MAGFLKETAFKTLLSDQKQQKARQRGRVHGPFSPKPAVMRRVRARQFRLLAGEGGRIRKDDLLVSWRR
jgi:hypothetical protein